MAKYSSPTTNPTSPCFASRPKRRQNQATIADLADLAEQVAIILTGVSIDQLREKFGGYRVYDPAAKKELVPSQEVQA
jgi:hypothetical protein